MTQTSETNHRRSECEKSWLLKRACGEYVRVRPSLRAAVRIPAAYRLHSWQVEWAGLSSGDRLAGSNGKNVVVLSITVISTASPAQGSQPPHCLIEDTHTHSGAAFDQMMFILCSVRLIPCPDLTGWFQEIIFKWALILTAPHGVK